MICQYRNDCNMFTTQDYCISNPELCESYKIFQDYENQEPRQTESELEQLGIGALTLEDLKRFKINITGTRD